MLIMHYHLSLPIAIAVMASLSAQAQSTVTIAVFSYQDTSCGAWVKSAESDVARAQYRSWFRGFVSGYNYGNPSRQVAAEKMPNEQTLVLFVDKHCRDNPLNHFDSAAFALVEALRDPPVPQEPKARR